MAEDNDLNSNVGDSTIAEYATYEDYLDSQITPLDMYYLEVSHYIKKNYLLNQ